MIFWNGLLDGVANPLTNNELYLSSNPLTNKPLDSTVFIPVILVSPCSRLEIPFLEISSAPIDCFCTIAFLCSPKIALSDFLLVLPLS